MYRLNHAASDILSHFATKKNYELLMASLFEKQEVTTTTKRGAVTLKGEDWFEEAEPYKPGEWNKCRKSRPVKEGDYLLRRKESDGGYVFEIRKYQHILGWESGLFETTDKIEFKEIV